MKVIRLLIAIINSKQESSESHSILVLGLVGVIAVIFIASRRVIIKSTILIKDIFSKEN